MANPYICSMYVHRQDDTRFLLVCENDPLPVLIGPLDWRLLAYGIEPPDRAKPWLKMRRYYQMHQFESDGGNGFGEAGAILG